MSSMIKHLISASALVIPAIAVASAASAQEQQKIVWKTGVGDGAVAVPNAQS